MRSVGKRITGALAMGVVLCLLAACGGSEGLPEEASTRLAPQVAAIRLAAESYAPDVALQKLAEVRETVSDLRRNGVIDDDQEARVLAAAADVEAHLALAPTTTTTTTTTTQPAPAPDEESDDESDDESDEKPGNGKGPGKK